MLMVPCLPSKKEQEKNGAQSEHEKNMDKVQRQRPRET
jgi:hypothetical protein